MAFIAATRPLYCFQWLLSPILLWIPLGLTQGLLLTRYIRGAAVSWTCGSVLGAVLSVFIVIAVAWGIFYAGIDYFVRFALFGGVGGMVVGLCQTFRLSERIDGARWWVLASAVGWTTAIFVEAKMNWHGYFDAMLGRGDIFQGTVTITIANTIAGIALSLLLAHHTD